MKLPSCLLLFFFSLILFVNAQDYSKMKGSEYCALKKSGSQAFATKPYSLNSGPAHTLSLIHI